MLSCLVSLKTSRQLILFIIVLEPNSGGEERITSDRVEVVVLCW